MRIVRGTYFWQFGSIASLPTETTDGLVAFLAQTWPQKRSQSAKIFMGGMPPDPPTCSHLRTPNGRTSPK